MNENPPEETREERENFTKRAVAEVLRTRISRQRLRQTRIAVESGISRTHLRSLLRAEKQMSLLIFLELSHALRFDDPCQLLRDVLNRRHQLLAKRDRAASTDNATG
ncbi:hypothetical protein [Steroidobacter sp.]|uniref:hypothetical protein n=1 Tax=Steroidobacter sp. TaxID=1978227 RepID=UPI001A5E954F|nr:hypothetical protein [Steroidobacter sp.]MBL8265886.1 hypothetical protein [Steroidobacter sp.]